MFAYLIIGIELAILYTVFWIVFIREPKPREIRAELWGSYQNPNQKPIKNDGKSRLPSYIFIDDSQVSTAPSQARTRSSLARKARKGRHLARRLFRNYLHSRSSCISCVCNCHSQAVLRYRRKRHWWRWPEDKLIASGLNPVEKFLLALNRVLNQFSVKLP